MEEFVSQVHERTKRGILIGMLGLTVVTTVGIWAAAGNDAIAGAMTMFGAVGYAVGALLWCQVDGAERGFRVGPGLRIAIILIVLVAVPYYFFKSRGAKEGGLSTASAFVFYLLIVLVASVTDLVLSAADGRFQIFN